MTPFNGGALQWQRWNGPAKGRPLLLLHGGFGSWTHWVANIPGLRETRTLWEIDIPVLLHFGISIWACSIMSPPNLAESFDYGD